MFPLFLVLEPNNFILRCVTCESCTFTLLTTVQLQTLVSDLLPSRDYNFSACSFRGRQLSDELIERTTRDVSVLTPRWRCKNPTWRLRTTGFLTGYVAVKRRQKPLERRHAHPDCLSYTRPVCREPLSTSWRRYSFSLQYCVQSDNNLGLS